MTNFNTFYRVQVLTASGFIEQIFVLPIQHRQRQAERKKNDCLTPIALITISMNRFS